MCMPGRFSRVRSVTLWTVALQGPWTPCPAVKDRPSGGMGEITAEVCGAGAVPTATTLQRKEQGWCLVWKGDSGKAIGYPHSGHQRTAFQTRWCLRERHSPPPTPPQWKAEILLFSSLQHNRTFILFESPVPEPLSQLLLLGVGGEEEGSCVLRILTRMPRALH